MQDDVNYYFRIYRRYIANMKAFLKSIMTTLTAIAPRRNKKKYHNPKTMIPLKHIINSKNLHLDTPTIYYLTR